MTRRAARREEAQLRQGGGPAAIERQHAKGRKTARERIEALLDPGAPVLELGLWAAYQMYEEWGGAPGAGVVTVIGSVARPPRDGRRQRRHGQGRRLLPDDDQEDPPRPDDRRPEPAAARLPGRFLGRLPADAGRGLSRTTTTSAGSSATTRCSRRSGIPQFAAIMGNCVAGGAYLPVLCDTVLMTEGSGLYLAGPALVKAAIGQEISHEELGRRPRARGDQRDGRLPRARRRRLPGAAAPADRAPAARPADADRPGPIEPPPRPADGPLRPRAAPTRRRSTTCATLLAAILDGGRLDEYRAEYGRTLVCGFGRLGGHRAGDRGDASGSGSGPKGAGRSSSAA